MSYLELAKDFSGFVRTGGPNDPELGKRQRQQDQLGGEISDANVVSHVGYSLQGKGLVLIKLNQEDGCFIKRRHEFTLRVPNHS